MVPIVRVLLLANARLHGEKTQHVSNGACKVGGRARISLSPTPLKNAHPRIPFADPRIPLLSPNLPPILNHKRQGAGSPVGIPIRVEGTHVVHLLQVDIGEDQLVVTAVDDGGAVRAGKHIGGGQRAESPQDGGLGPKGHLLPVTQQTCRKGAPALGAAATELARAGRQSATRLQHLGKK